jgi:uncharacterized protein HemX
MMIFGREIAKEVIGLVVVALLIVLAATLGPAACQKIRSLSAQQKVTQGQLTATQNSAADAVNTATGVGANAAASEELGRKNSEQIHAAPGANDRVNAGVDAAGRAALCRRAAYRDDPKCKGAR